MTNRQYNRELINRKKEDENIYTPIFYRAIRATKAPVIKVAKEQGLTAALTQAGVMNGEHFKKALNSLYTSIGPREAKWQYQLLSKTKDVKAGFGFSIDFLADIADYLYRNILDKVVQELTSTTLERVYRAIVNGNAAGQSYDEIVAKLEDTELDKTRARLIARTESNRATNAGHVIGAKAYPYEVNKVWLSARDRRTRGAEGDDKADHYHMNGKEVAESESFTDPRNGAVMGFPGDSSQGAPAVSICNCRCNCRFIPQRNANGRLILRQNRLVVPL